MSRGVRQGSVISPYLLNIFLNDLLLDLTYINSGLRIGDVLYNSFAYADDITLINPTVPGLQLLIDRCMDYSMRWRFNFGIKKSNCMVHGKDLLTSSPEWFLGDIKLPVTEVQETLGTTFSKDGFVKHVENRMRACRASYYSLANAGLCYPGLSTESKVYTWKTVCVPSLTYGCEAITLSDKQISVMESCQGSLVKQFLGIGKRSHHSKLLQALHIQPVESVVLHKTMNFYNQIFRTENPLRSLCCTLLARYIVRGDLIPGSIIDRVVKSGCSPVKAAFVKPSINYGVPCVDGMVDSLRFLTLHENFIKPWTAEHIITKLLTRAF